MRTVGIHQLSVRQTRGWATPQWVPILVGTISVRQTLSVLLSRTHLVPNQLLLQSHGHLMTHRRGRIRWTTQLRIQGLLWKRQAIHPAWRHFKHARGWQRRVIRVSSSTKNGFAVGCLNGHWDVRWHTRGCDQARRIPRWRLRQRRRLR